MTAQVSWAHLDANGHMANTAYMNLAIDARFQYFTQQGFAPADFARLRIGPVARREEIDFFRELHLQQTVKVDFQLAGISPDASRFRIRNHIRREDGELCARITSLAGWFDLNARKLVAPPPELAAALRGLEPSEDFQELESSVRRS